MKKILFIIVLFVIPYWVEAKVVTYPRSGDNLLVPNDVVVTDENREVILKTPAVNSSLKLYDFAEVLSSEEDNKIAKKLQDYTVVSGLDAVVIVTKDLYTFDIWSYLYAFYDFNDFKDSGVVFVVYVGEEKPTIVMTNIGSDPLLNRLYSKRVIQDTLKYVYKDIKNGNYYTALDNYVRIIQGFYNLEKKSGDYVVNEEGEIVKVIPWVELIILGVALTFIVDILWLYHIRGLQKNKEIGLAHNIMEDSLVVKLEKDELI